jgi:hypothetical protein
MLINYKYNSLHHRKCIYSCLPLHCADHCVGQLQSIYLTLCVALTNVINKPILIYLNNGERYDGENVCFRKNIMVTVSFD